MSDFLNNHKTQNKMETETKPFDPWNSYPRRVIRRKPLTSSYNTQTGRNNSPPLEQLKKTQHYHTLVSTIRTEKKRAKDSEYRVDKRARRKPFWGPKHQPYLRAALTHNKYTNLWGVDRDRKRKKEKQPGTKYPARIELKQINLTLFGLRSKYTNGAALVFPLLAVTLLLR